MHEPYLEVTFRHGKPLAAYLYLPGPEGRKSTRTQEFDGGLLVDYASDEKPIGVEITSPSRLTLDQLNQVLAELGHNALTSNDLAPLNAA